MSKIKRIKLRLKSGLLSELQSDTIFGSFCWRMKEMLGEDKLLSFLEFYKNGNPVFSVSNGFLSDKDKDDNIFFPNPQIPYNYEPVSKKKTEKIQSFLEYKEKKRISYISLKHLNKLLSSQDIGVEVETEIPAFDEDLRTSVEIDRNTMTAKKGNLFSYAPKYLNKHFLNIFIKIIDYSTYKDFDCEAILKETFHIGFGKKKSSGYGEMEVLDFSDFNGFEEPKEGNGFIVLSNYLPSKNDGIIDMFYDFHVKYSKLGEEYSKNSNPFKRPIIFFKPGSVFMTPEVRDFYGRTTKEREITYYPGIIQNGIAFTLRIKLKEHA